MINTQDQEDLFKLISEYLESDIRCVAIGGTAMMFLGYKNTTKDIDIVFNSKKDREIFIKAINQIGYKERSILGVYDEKRKKDKDKPLMYSRGEERFDLFVTSVFGFLLNKKVGDELQRRDFIGKQELSIDILSAEFLVMLKAITGRPKDYEDIETILDIEKTIDWSWIVTEAVKQRKNKNWILYDLEETMQRLRKKYLIKQKYFDILYEAES